LLEWNNSCDEKGKVAEVTVVAGSSSQPLTDTPSTREFESKTNQSADRQGGNGGEDSQLGNSIGGEMPLIGKDGPVP
jgi:hypothetical protein